MSLLSYIIKTYVNGTTPALNATNMNGIETFLSQAHAEIAARNSNDVGIITHHVAASIPDGWLKCDGTHYNASTYPVYAPLYNILGTTFGGNSISDFAVPDLRGVFIRGYDDGVGRDSGRTFGSYQADTVPNHRHSYTDNCAGGNFGYDTNYNTTHSPWGYTSRSLSTSDAASESRPKNLSFVPIIKYTAAALKTSPYTKNPYTAGYGTQPVNATTRNHLEAGLGDAKNRVNNWITPVGSMVWYPKYSTPTGWLYANGQAVLRTDFANLFSVIGTTYGAGNGSTTFNVPDIRGYFVRGVDSMGRGARGLDSGRAWCSVQTSQMLAHYHTLLHTSFGGTNYTGGGITGHNNGGVTSYTGYAGDSEFRPKNIALIALIKY